MTIHNHYCIIPHMAGALRFWWKLVLIFLRFCLSVRLSVNMIICKLMSQNNKLFFEVVAAVLITIVVKSSNWRKKVASLTKKIAQKIPNFTRPCLTSLFCPIKSESYLPFLLSTLVSVYNQFSLYFLLFRLQNNVKSEIGKNASVDLVHGPDQWPHLWDWQSRRWVTNVF